MLQLNGAATNVVSIDGGAGTTAEPAKVKLINSDLNILSNKTLYNQQILLLQILL